MELALSIGITLTQLRDWSYEPGVHGHSSELAIHLFLLSIPSSSLLAASRFANIP